MNLRSSVRALDWAVPLGFGTVLCLMVPLRTALEFGADEGYELMKAFLVSLGHPLYREVWNDQPPLHTELLALLFRVFGASAYVGRLLSVGFAMALLGLGIPGSVAGDGVADLFMAPALLVLLWTALGHTAYMARSGWNRGMISSNMETRQ